MKNIKKLLSLFWVCLLFACTDISGLESDIDKLNSRVTSLESALAALNKAHSENKLISSVTPTASGDGWVITFSDQQTITVVNGANNATLIKSIVQDDESGIVKITMQDGSVFSFGLNMTSPTSISVLSKKEYINKSGKCTFNIAINPSNAKISTSAEGSDANVFLNLVNKSRASYVSAPTNFKIDQIKAIDSSDKTEGQYQITLAELGKSANYVEDITVVILTKNGIGEDVYISSDMMTIEWRNGEDFYDFRIGEKVGLFNGNNITIQLPKGTDVTSLVPTFKSNGKVAISGKTQVSGVSVQDFTRTKEYTVTDAEGTIRTYKVTVELK